jgi:hypothetical protein
MSSNEALVDKVVILHMTNGQPVIGKVAEVRPDANEIVLYRAMELMFMQNPRQPGAVSVSYTPFLAFGGVLPPLEKMPVSLADTLLVRSDNLVPKTVEDGYLQAISGLQLAPAGAEKSLQLVKP